MKRPYASMNSSDLIESEYLITEPNDDSASGGITFQDVSLLNEDDSSKDEQDVEVYVEDITHAIVDFVVIDCRPLSVTQGKGFQRLIHLLAPGYVLPDKQKLTLAMRKRFEEVRREREQGIPLDRLKVSVHSTDLSTWPTCQLDRQFS